MAKFNQVHDIEVPHLELSMCSMDEYCHFFSKSKYNGFMWYMFPHRIFGNYARPFQNQEGYWYYWIRPGLCYPVDFLDTSYTPPSFSRAFIGYQHAVESAYSNSNFAFRLIRDIKHYSIANLSKNRRKLIRRGYKYCGIEVFKTYEASIVDECYHIWKDHYIRTQWKKPLSLSYFHNSWRELLDAPGTTIIVTRSKETGRILGWFLFRVMGNIAWGDTIVSLTDKERRNPNDAMLFAFIDNARKIEKIDSLYYGLKSNIETLETFKESMRIPVEYIPATVWIHPLIKLPLQIIYPSLYKRLTGDI